jgi:hypothetical protein
MLICLINISQANPIRAEFDNYCVTETTKSLSKIEEKLNQIVDIECKYADEYGTSHFDTCNAFSYGWDKDVWNYRHEVIDAIMRRGYNVSTTNSYGVTRVLTKTKLNLK